MIRIRHVRDRLRSSLFYVPMLFVVAGFVLGQVALEVDDRIENVPTRLTATVESARTVLGVVAGATITFAGIAFSVSLLLISLASSQYSPRVVHGLFRDPFNKRIMGVVVGTFTYCLIVLRAVRSPLEDGGTPIIPSVSVALGVLLGIVTILSIVAFISHSAHSMDVSKILHSVTSEALTAVRDQWPLPDGAPPGEISEEDDRRPGAEALEVTFDSHGWVQQVDRRALLECLEPGAVMRVTTAPGRYAVIDTPLCTISPRPSDADGATAAVREAVIVGETRTMEDDAGYGVRQLADVALKALSPGINDPTTAQDAMFHLATVVRELLVRIPPQRRVEGEDRRVLLMPESLRHDEVVEIAFDEVRIAAAGQPTMQVYLLEILSLLAVSLRGNCPEATLDRFRHQADLIVEMSDDESLPEADRERVRAAYRSRFG